MFTKLIVLCFSLLAGVFFLIGNFIVSRVKDKKSISVLSIGMSFVVMLGMLLTDLIPEIINLSNAVSKEKNTKLIYIFTFIILGIVLLKIMDIFMPHHTHHHHENEDETIHDKHMSHIGFMTTISLILHNILEGMSIYILGLTSLTTGFLTSLAIGAHNLPLGIEISSSMAKDNKKQKIITFLFLTISSFIGALIVLLIGDLLPLMELILISLASGMILYITLFELLKEIFNYKKEKKVYQGMLIGILLIIIMTIIN